MAGRLRPDDQAFLFEDAAAFLQELEQIERTGGILVEAPPTTPLRQPMSYRIVLLDEPALELRAEAVFAAGGKVGFQLFELAALRPALAALGERARALVAAPPRTPTVELARVAGAPPAAVPAEAVARDDEVDTISAEFDEARSLTAALPAVEFEHTGEVVAPLSVEHLLASEGRQARLTAGEPLPVFQAILAAAEQGSRRTLELGGWALGFSGRRIVSFRTPDADTCLRHLKKKLGNELEKLKREVAPGRTLEKLALERKLLEPNELARGLYQMLLARSRELLALTTGSYRLRSGLAETPLAAVSFELVVRDLLRASLQRLPTDALRRFMNERERRAVSLRAGTDPVVTQLAKGQSRYERWLTRLDGSLPLVEMLRQAPFSHQSAYELIAVLLALDACTFSSPRVAAINAEQALADWLTRVEVKQPFAALGLHWSAPASEIERRFAAHKDELKPGGELARWSPRAGELAKEVLARLERAHATLLDKEKRREARRSVATQAEIFMARELYQKQIILAGMRGQRERVHELEAVLTELGVTVDTAATLRLDVIK